MPDDLGYAWIYHVPSDYQPVARVGIAHDGSIAVSLVVHDGDGTVEDPAMTYRMTTLDEPDMRYRTLPADAVIPRRQEVMRRGITVENARMLAAALDRVANEL